MILSSCISFLTFVGVYLLLLGMHVVFITSLVLLTYKFLY
jgi:hypothetical protein